MLVLFCLEGALPWLGCCYPFASCLFLSSVPNTVRYRRPPSSHLYVTIESVTLLNVLGAIPPHTARGRHTVHAGLLKSFKLILQLTVS